MALPLVSRIDAPEENWVACIGFKRVDDILMESQNNANERQRIENNATELKECANISALFESLQSNKARNIELRHSNVTDCDECTRMHVLASLPITRQFFFLR